MTNEWIEQEIEIFGDHVEIPQETLDAYAERCRLTGIEMDRFFDSLPDFIDEDDYFSMWMMTDAERVEFIEAKRPTVEPIEDITKAKYFQKPLYQERKPETLGGVRF